MLAYVRQHPFSTMALANIVGDSCYLGYAFAADGWISPSKLAGALFTLVAHLLLLAYGDMQAARIASEKGRLSRAVMRLRRVAQFLTERLPTFIGNCLRGRPVGICFFMLSLNGLALLVDAFQNRYYGHGLTMIIQGFMGVLIAIGTGSFAVAGFVKTQSRSNLFTGIAPMVLLAASAVNIALALMTRNLFIAIAVVAFLISNFAGFYTRLDKSRGLSANCPDYVAS